MQNDKPIAFEGRILNDTERKYQEQEEGAVGLHARV
jgi:hypothetical protein